MVLRGLNIFQVVVGATMAFGVAPAAAVTFPEALAAAAEAHPQVAAARETAAAGRADIRAARAGWRPQVSLTGDAGWSRSGLTSKSDTALLPGVRASQMIYDGGRTSGEVERLKQRAEALEATRERAVLDVAQRLADAYLEWNRQRALLAIAEEQVTALAGLRETVAAIATFDQGRASDAALVTTRLSQAEATRDARRVALADARVLVRQAASADIEPTGDMPPVASMLPARLEAALAAAAAHPAVRAAAFDARAASAAADAARGWWRPQVSIDAGSQSESDLTGRSRLFGTLELKLRSTLAPIDGGAGAARLASARSAAAAARYDASFTETALRDEVLRQWTAVSGRRDRLPGLAALVGNTDESRNVVAEQFRIGRRSILDLLSFEVERFGARTQLETERQDLIAAQYRLLGATGTLATAFLARNGG
jgi:outer membrane protein TolC